MPDDSSSGDQFFFTRERVLTFVLAAATLIALYICYQIAKPFIPPIAFALALAVATQRPYNWIHRKFPNNTVAAAVAVVLVALLIVGPAIFLGIYLVQTASDSVKQLQSGDPADNWRTTLEQQPYIGELFRWAESRLELEDQLRRIGEALAGQAGNFLRRSMNVLTQLVIMLFVLFFLYRDRKEAHHALRQLVPLSAEEADKLFSRVASTIMATVNGSMTVALVQATLAGTIYFILGVPGAAIWAAVTFITALVPVFGTFLVWGPIALYLALSGSPIKALVLVGWGLLAIGTIDNILYPFLVGDRLRLHTVPTFFAILGGITLFGASGLILGPLVLAITIALIDVWWLRTMQGRAAEEAVVENRMEEEPPGTVLQDHVSEDGRPV